MIDIDRKWISMMIVNDRQRNKWFMNKAERHDRILALAGENGMLYMERAAQATGASLPTLRRDFAELEETGAVQRVRGGVRIIQKEGSLSFSIREVQHSKAKAAIAKKAAQLLRAHEVVIIDGGTTTCHLCMFLPPIPLRIITNSLRIASYLDDSTHRRGDWEVYLTGGRVQHGSNMLTGPGTLHTLDFYYADWAFLSVGGITDDGLYNTSEPIVETERKMIERSNRAVVLADQSKLGRRAMCRVCGIEVLDRVITNPHPGRSLVEEAMLERGILIEHTE